MLLVLYFVWRKDPSVKSVCDVPITKFILGRVVNPTRSRKEASNGLGRRMGAAVGMCIFLECSISQVPQMIVLCEPDLFCTGERMLEMEGC